MAWKSILTVQLGIDADDPLRAAAIDLAIQNDAHLEVLAIGIDRTQTGHHYSEISAAVYQQGLAEARENAITLEQHLDGAIADLALRASVTPLVVPSGTIGADVARYARFADLVVLNLPYGPGAIFEEPAIVEAALFLARVPVLLVPRGHSSHTAPKRVLLGWNESLQALSAARAALPILQSADTAFVSVIDPPRHGPDRSDPGGLLCQYLARQGVRCEVDVLARSMPRVGDVMLRALTDRDADLLVMGAYGRARWSEAMFGGATRHMLEHAPVPVLMAH